MIDRVSLFTSIRARLIGDATLMALVSGVFQLSIPSTVTFALPALELGEQASTLDPASGYGQRAEDLRIRLMCHAKGSAPGVGSTDALYAALKRADTLLISTALVAANQTLWLVQFSGSVPGTSTPDPQGIPRLSAGIIYRVRSIEA